MTCLRWMHLQVVADIIRRESAHNSSHAERWRCTNPARELVGVGSSQLDECTRGATIASSDRGGLIRPPTRFLQTTPVKDIDEMTQPRTGLADGTCRQQDPRWQSGSMSVTVESRHHLPMTSSLSVVGGSDSCPNEGAAVGEEVA